MFKPRICLEELKTFFSTVVIHNMVDRVTTIHNRIMWYLNTSRG